MDNMTTEIITLSWYLLPGFFAAWIYYGFTSYPKPSQFERVIQALIFTLLVQALVFCIKQIAGWIWNFHATGGSGEQFQLVLSVACACLIGLSFAYFTNTDKLHRLMRRVGVTKETSYPSEWFGVFAKNITYVVLHLEDERRIYGWPIEWPSKPGEGHFLLREVSWVHGSEGSLAGVDSILIRAQDVRWVEFMENKWEKDHGKKSIKSTSA